MQTRIRNKAGKLTLYGFACGYVEEVGDFVTIEKEGFVYHVKRHPEHHKGSSWETHINIRWARKAARRLSR